MQEVNAIDFYRHIADFEWVPFTQTLAFNRSIVDEQSLHFYIDNPEQPSLGCVGYERRKAGLKMLCVNGECLRYKQTINRKIYAEFYSALHDTGFDIYSLNISTPYSADAEIALRTSGWLRPVGLFSTELSKIVTTNADIKYDKSWKHNLKKAHEAGLQVNIRDAFDASDIREYISHHKELLKRKGFNEGLSEEGLAQLSRDPHFKMCTVTDEAGTTLAGCIFYAHPNASTTMYSFSTPEGRENGAAYCVRESIIAYLAQQGIATLDLGRLSPAAHKKNNLFLFKDGISGAYVQYLGEFEYCRRGWQAVALYFLKKHLWKRVRV